MSLEEDSYNLKLNDLMLKVFKLVPTAQVPRFMTPGSACFDLEACFHGPVKGCDSGNNKITKSDEMNHVVIHPGERLLIPTGLILDIPAGYFVEIFNRSSTAWKQGLMLTSSRVIDSDYVEELMLPLCNFSSICYTLTSGDRVAQGRLIKLDKYEMCESGVRPQRCERTGGFGSTGK